MPCPSWINVRQQGLVWSPSVASKQGAVPWVALWGGVGRWEWEWLDSGSSQLCGGHSLCLRPTDPQAAMLVGNGGREGKPWVVAKWTGRGLGTVGADSFRSSLVRRPRERVNKERTGGGDKLGAGAGGAGCGGASGEQQGGFGGCCMRMSQGLTFCTLLTWAGKVGAQGHSTGPGHSAWCSSPAFRRNPRRPQDPSLPAHECRKQWRRAPELTLATAPCPARSPISLSPWDNQGSTSCGVFSEQPLLTQLPGGRDDPACTLAFAQLGVTLLGAGGPLGGHQCPEPATVCLLVSSAAFHVPLVLAAMPPHSDPGLLCSCGRIALRQVGCGEPCRS